MHNINARAKIITRDTPKPPETPEIQERGLENVEELDSCETWKQIIL